MAKGRKFSTSRSERLLGASHTQGSTATESTELREEDVWSVAEDFGRDVNLSPGEWESRALRRSRNREQQDHGHLGGLSLAFEDPRSNVATTSSRVVRHQFRASPHGGHHMATSAPVNVPDWSKILRVDSVESMHDVDDGFDDNEPEMVPPHEYLARGRKMAANSVFEGVGRTLKGRDMRRVRDAVWNQTGFDG